MKKAVIAFISFLIISLCVTASFADSGNTYKDKVTGLTFTIPSGWKEEPLSKEREIIKAKFIPEDVTLSDYAGICYGYVDMWNSIPDEYKIGLTRADFDSSLFTMDDMKDIMGSYSSGSTTVSIKDIDTVTYNGIEYYRLTSSTSSYGITLPLIQLMYVDNGYIYQFQYMGSTSSKYYTDFESLVKSAVYKTTKPAATATPKPTSRPAVTAKPTAKSNQNTTSSGSSYSSYSSYNRRSNQTSYLWASLLGIALWALIPGFIAKHKGRSFAGYYFLSFAITPLVTTIITICLKNLNKTSTSNNPVRIATQPVYHREQETQPSIDNAHVSNAPTNESIMSAPGNTESLTRTAVVPDGKMRCSKCGEIQNAGRSVCWSCGAVFIDEKGTTEDSVIKPYYNPEPFKPAEETSASAPQINNSVMNSEHSKEPLRLRFCRYCGFELLENSEFCSHCGRKVY